MKFLHKFKPSRVVARKDSHTKSRAIEGAVIRSEPVPTRKPGGKPKDTEIRDHLVLYATNTWSIIRLDLGVQDPFQEPGPVPMEALRHMEQGVQFGLGLDKVKVGIVEYDRVFVDSPDDIAEEQFPEWERTIKKLGWKNEPSGVNKVTVDLNPKLLLALAQAIGAEEGVRLTFDLRLTKEYPGRKKSRYVTGPMRVQNRNAETSERVADSYLMPMLPLLSEEW